MSEHVFKSYIWMEKLGLQPPTLIPYNFFFFFALNNRANPCYLLYVGLFQYIHFLFILTSSPIGSCNNLCYTKEKAYA